ncbi:MAG: ferrochelatase [Deltaproteobacteria bacterium]|nr:MAG: ferrochelatase [Deltaproteobacteria bacterium]
MIPLRRPSTAPHTGVLLLNLGGPDSLDAVEPYLENLFRDPFLIRIPLLKGPLRRWFARAVARRRAPHARQLYAEIGGRSPILPLTEAQARKLEEELGPGFRCYVAFSAWTPYIRDAVARARADGCTRLVGVSLYPQWCSATTESAFFDLRKAVAGSMPVAAVDRYPEDAGYLDALTSTVQVALRRFPDPARVHVLFSAHGVPISLIRRGDPYEREIHATVAGVVRRLPPGQKWSLSYQSKVGPVKWLQPATIDHIPGLARQGVREVLVVPVAFVSDHVETLHEQRILLRGVAAEAGIARYEVANAINDCRLYARALARLVRQALDSTPVFKVPAGR